MRRSLSCIKVTIDAASARSGSYLKVENRARSKSYREVTRVRCSEALFPEISTRTPARWPKRPFAAPSNSFCSYEVNSKLTSELQVVGRGNSLYNRRNLIFHKQALAGQRISGSEYDVVQA
jgi:hypothetical protein